MTLTPELGTKLVGFIEKVAGVLAETDAAKAKQLEKSASFAKGVKTVVATLVKQGLCVAERADAKEEAYRGEGGAMLLLSDLNKAASMIVAQSIGGPAGAGPVPGALDETELSADDAYAQKLMSVRA
jgi:hypothetical protein